MLAAESRTSPMNDLQQVRRALISTSNKDGLEAHARALAKYGVKLISTGGTKSALASAGLDVEDVSTLTGFPEMMDGRLKTLHPLVHGALLGRRDAPDHVRAMDAHGIMPIDLLYVNLYPFEETVERGAPFAECVENIDIGGPAMIRAAAKNFEFVVVATDSEDMTSILEEMRERKGFVSLETRRRLAAKAYARTAAYDAAISNWFFTRTNEQAPHWRAFGGALKQTLRYGENPHQSGAFYSEGRPRKGVITARQIGGRELSYINILDADAAFELVAEFDPARTAAVAIIKHANPCGVAEGSSLLDAYLKALRCDPVSAFGGIVALNRPLDAAAAQEIVKIFTEVIVAPDASAEAQAIVAAKKNLRLLLPGALPDPKIATLTVRSVAGGWLVQDRDAAVVEDMDLQVVTRRPPSARELADLRFAFKVAKHVKSNAIVYAKDGATVGIGAGQMSRVDSSTIAARKALEAAKTAGLSESLAVGSVVASDAFFPFADGLLAAAEAGATAIIQPGGSVRDEEVIAAANDKGLAMVFTGVRHFRH